MKFFQFSRPLQFLMITCLSACLVIWIGFRTIYPRSDRIAPQEKQVVLQPPLAVPTPTSSPGFIPLFTPTPQPSPSANIPSPILQPPLGPPTPSSVSPPQPFPQMVTRYGHFPYQEDDPQRLRLVGKYYDREEFLDFEATEAFKRMQTEAASTGVELIPISGFRTIVDQEKLFERQVQRQGSEIAAARLSAPAGYSEHHTGYALDIGDRQAPNTDLKFTFADTTAYHWLTAHAHRYGFELSFPQDNLQRVSFEPWHWRFIGSSRAAEVFFRARSLVPS